MPKRMPIPIGTKIGRWTIIDNTDVMHICKCDCGTVKPIKMYSLLCGDSTSCGCSHREMPSELERAYEWIDVKGDEG